jgi:hypothetical protein
MGYLNSLQVIPLPINTGTVTLLFVDIETKLVVGITLSYLNMMAGPDKIYHGPVFWRFKDDIPQFENDNNNRVSPSRHFSLDAETHTKIMFLIQDQPERR